MRYFLFSFLILGIHNAQVTGLDGWDLFIDPGHSQDENMGILNPEGSRMIFFEECKNSTKPHFKIDTHLFYTNHLGEPEGYKSSEKLNIDLAWEKWHELHQRGWTEVAYYYG